MKTPNSIQLQKLNARVIAATGSGDNRLELCEYGPGLRAISTNGDPVFEEANPAAFAEIVAENFPTQNTGAADSAQHTPGPWTMRPTGHLLAAAPDLLAALERAEVYLSLLADKADGPNVIHRDLALTRVAIARAKGGEL
jgi:hypothetical protein